MTTMLALDPGAKKCGVAAFADRELVNAWCVAGEDWIELANQVEIIWRNHFVADPSILVFERMQVYSSNRKGDQNDLVTLSLMAGRVTGMFLESSIVSYLPSEWKGQVPKGVMATRILDRVSKMGSIPILPKSKKKALDVIDAIGIGLYHWKIL